jgi:predicted acyl esterase
MRRLLVVVSLLAGVVVPLTTATSSPVAAAEAFTARGSVNQVYVLDAPANTVLELLDASDAVVQTGQTDAKGTELLREVPAGTGYQVRIGTDTVEGLTVTGPTDHPTDAWYQQNATDHPLGAGYGYLTTRDGTTLSINITMPVDDSPGPWPVVVNYSGYDPSQPGDPPREAAVYPYQGYVVVGVNMRGTGCSGGAFEFMETLQGTDGYDVIETIAHQSWANGNVGMVGISYSGYSQLYVGATNPPHLDAITPLSPYSDTYSGILYPGGILNDGFAVDWATEREDGAKPAARPWAKTRINNGDATCARNQLLRDQSKPLLQRIHNTPYADHEFDYLNTETFVDEIKMPVYLASQWQDEQTGGSAANLIPFFDPETEVWGSFTNGTHVEPMAPSELFEALVFIDLFVGKRIPHTSRYLSFGAAAVLADLFGSDDIDAFGFPFNAWYQQPSYEAALAYYRSRPRIRIKWDNGTVTGEEGLPLSPITTRFTNWPPTGLINEKLYLQPDGGLATTVPTVPDTAARASSSYTYDPTTKRDHTFTGGTDAMWVAHPNVKWDVLDEGNSLNFVSAPYATKAAYAGQGSVDLWVRSSAADTDLEATLTEVRPDGQEVFIQSGWLRASHRLEDPARSTELVPYQDHQEADAAPLPAGQFTKVRLEVFPFAHVIRPGSRLRVNIEAPGGNQPFWAFQTLAGPATNEIGHSSGMPSRVVLPRLPNNQVPNVPAALPACTLPGVTQQAVSLRGQPCRAYVPPRIPTAVVATPFRDDIRLTWTAPPGAQPTLYRITPRLGAGAPSGAVAPAPVEVAGTATNGELADVPTDVPLELTVTAVYAGVDGPASDASLPVEVDPLPIRLFDTYTAFVTTMLTGFNGAANATPAAVAAGVAALEGGQDPAAWVATLRRNADAVANVDPVSRLYLAYFQRLPDAGGLRYWVGKRRAGTTLSSISSTFAGSNEFKTKYGSLSNEAFVRRIYTDVLGRTADEKGVTFWTKQLDLRRRTRGSVMIGFSESNEFKGKAAHRVDVANIWIGIRNSRPSAPDELMFLGFLSGGSPVSFPIDLLLHSLESGEIAP